MRAKRGHRIDLVSWIGEQERLQRALPQARLNE
jgi:hypothetical protein